MAFLMTWMIWGCHDFGTFSRQDFITSPTRVTATVRDSRDLCSLETRSRASMIHSCRSESPRSSLDLARCQGSRRWQLRFFKGHWSHFMEYFRCSQMDVDQNSRLSKTAYFGDLLVNSFWVAPSCIIPILWKKTKNLPKNCVDGNPIHLGFTPGNKPI